MPQSPTTHLTDRWQSVLRMGIVATLFMGLAMFLRMRGW